MTKEQLAEREYPHFYSEVEPCADSTEVVIRERAAFIKGLEVNEQYREYLGKWFKGYFSIPALEDFLTEKYNNEQTPME